MGDLRSLAESVGALLKERGETVAVTESSAGGLVSAALLAAPGASAYFVGGAVVYTRTAQQGLLRVPEEAMEGLRASTEEYALLNARTARELLGTTWGPRGDGGQRADGEQVRGQPGTLVRRGVGAGRGIDHPGDRVRRPRGEHVDLRQDGARPAGTVRQGGLGILNPTHRHSGESRNPGAGRAPVIPKEERPLATVTPAKAGVQGVGDGFPPPRERRP